MKEYPGQLYRIGSTGSEVTEIQERLNELGFNAGVEDGIFGPNTQRAVEGFQQDGGLKVDGIVGPESWSALFSTSNLKNNQRDSNDKLTDEICKIYIDPGHGGSDSGAVGNGLQEKDVVLQISKIQKEQLEQAGYAVRMARKNDMSLALIDRTHDANIWGADMYISNHVNAGGGVGAEVFHSIHGGKGQMLALEVMHHLAGIFRSRGIKSKKGENGDYYHVIRETNMPAILIEHGFIDHDGDATILKDPIRMDRIAMATVHAIRSIASIK